MLAAGQPRRLREPLPPAIPFVALPPLPAFAIYSVCVHTPAHTGRLIGHPVRVPRVRDNRCAASLALPVTASTLPIGPAL